MAQIKQSKHLHAMFAIWFIAAVALPDAGVKNDCSLPGYDACDSDNDCVPFYGYIPTECTDFTWPFGIGYCCTSEYFNDVWEDILDFIP